MIKNIYGALEGVDGLAVGELDGPVIWLLEDEDKAAKALSSVQFFSPSRTAIMVLAFDCLPYDSFSPSIFIAASRAAALAKIKTATNPIIIASLASAMQKLPPIEVFNGKKLKIHTEHSFDEIQKFLHESGYMRVDLVSSQGEYAVRGGIIDVHPAGEELAVRIDFFGDDIEEIRLFDVDSQRSLEKINEVYLFPSSEIILNEKSQLCFQNSYIDNFGFAKTEDRLYAAIVEGQRYKGIEQYLPLFYEKQQSIFDYCKNVKIVFSEQLLTLVENRDSLTNACYEGRIYSKVNALKPDKIFFNKKTLTAEIKKYQTVNITPFNLTSADPANAKNYNSQQAFNFVVARRSAGTSSETSLIENVRNHVNQSKKIIIFAAANSAQVSHLKNVLPDFTLTPADTIEHAKQIKLPEIPLISLDIEQGIETPDFVIFCKEDVLGATTKTRRLANKKARPNRTTALMAAEAIQLDDLVVHQEHGIGKFGGLVRIDVSNAQHDCLLIIYAQNDRLFIPVENADLVSRYGTAGENISLDRLGSNAWLGRKEKVKKRLWEMAGELIEVAAQRQVFHSQRLNPPEGIYEEFCSGFSFEETPDQAQAIEDVLEDFASGKIMDRLICGDVGFGKTEIALRAAFIQTMAGKQVAVVVPTTLLCRQHFENFKQRFQDFPIRIGQLSRFVSLKESAQAKQELAEGTLDIVIGTHALLSQQIEFKNIGLAIIDEEQHFGVQHKERLKEMRADVHILTLTATPIPRTLQLALSGAREVSLIGDPPLGRLASHNFTGSFDAITISQALLREKKRNGQSFFVCPRIKDLQPAMEFLENYTPDLTIAQAHGRMRPNQLEEQVGIFYEGVADVLLSTNIVEAGLDIARANTLIIWHAHKFGLAQLHQLRGRVGRSKELSYVYFTLPTDQSLTRQAEKRLLTLQATQFLGAGFALAAKDLDQRGAGNLLGSNQSGHIKEIGYELYQKMLAEAVSLRKSTKKDETLIEESFSPRVRMPAAILIPEKYIPDMRLRLTLYRRIAELNDDEALLELEEEITDRFGEIPSQLIALFYTVRLKSACKKAYIESLDIGDSGIGIRFFKNQFENISGLVNFIESLNKAKLTSDHRLIIDTAKMPWNNLDEKFETTLKTIRNIEKIRRQK